MLRDLSTLTIWHQHRTRYQIWGTIDLHCVSKNLTHQRRPKKFHFLRILPQHNTVLLSHVSQSVRDGFPRKKTTVLLLVPNCPLLTLGAKLSGVKIVLHSSLKQHTAPVADYKWNSPCLVGLRASALSPVVSAVHNVNYNTNGQLTHERCTCSFAIEIFV